MRLFVKDFSACQSIREYCQSICNSTLMMKLSARIFGELLGFMGIVF